MPIFYFIEKVWFYVLEYTYCNVEKELRKTEPVWGGNETEEMEKSIQRELSERIEKK